jgi:hypothetical protein
MTNEPQESGYRSETTRERAEAMNLGPETPLGAEEELRQREVAEKVNLGPNTEDLDLDERSEHRARHVNPASHTDLPDDEYERGVAGRMNPGPQDYPRSRDYPPAAQGLPAEEYPATEDVSQEQYPATEDVPPKEYPPE